MSYHIVKTSILSEAVPTDGTIYYAGEGRWSNDYDNRKLFETEDAARKEVVIEKITGISYLPKGIQFVSE